MLDAKVDTEVIRSYVKNSGVGYHLSAAEIVELKKRGVPDEIVAAMLQREAEVRAQAVSPNPYQNQYQYPPGAGSAPYAMDSYPYDYSDYGSPYYGSYPYSYPYYYPYNYWWYNYAYPWYGFYWPYYYANYHHFHDHDGHHGHRAQWEPSDLSHG